MCIHGYTPDVVAFVLATRKSDLPNITGLELRFLLLSNRFRLYRPLVSSSKHILNAQVSIRAPCCKAWYDCAECHAESQSHRLAKTAEMAFMCKKCKKAFRKDMTTYEESDEYCPHCDNHYVIEAKTPKPVLGVEGEDARVDARMLKDDRTKDSKNRSIFLQDFSDRVG